MLAHSQIPCSSNQPWLLEHKPSKLNSIVIARAIVSPINAIKDLVESSTAQLTLTQRSSLIPFSYKHVYPLPTIDETLDTLSGSQLFSTLNLASGYWQVEVSDEDRQKTAFCTTEGLYEFKVMPFGLCNAPATFQRLMDLILAGLQWTSCLVYLDDIIIFGNNFADHLQKLQLVVPGTQTGRKYRATPLVQIWDQLVIKDGLLFRKYLNNQKRDVHYQMVIPKAMRMEVLEELHGGISGGHLGEDKTLQKLKQRFISPWPNP